MSRKLMVAGIMALSMTMFGNDYEGKTKQVNKHTNVKTPHWKDTQSNEDRAMKLAKAQQKRERKAKQNNESELFMGSRRRYQIQAEVTA